MVGDSFMEMAHVSTAKWRSLTTGSMAECCYSLWSATGEGVEAGLAAGA